MKIRLQLIIEENSDRQAQVEDIFCLEREELTPVSLGITLNESKMLLHQLQQAVVAQQLEQYLERQKTCPHCGLKRSKRGSHNIVYRTIFGKLHLLSPRLFHCQCRPQANSSFSPLAELLPERTSPERMYLEAKYASLMSYGLSVKVLEEVLPLDGELNHTSLRNHLHSVAERMEEELGDEQFMFIDGCESEWGRLPRPDLPLTVGIDGGYVHACPTEGANQKWFEVIVGKSMPADGSQSKCFGLVNNYDKKPKRRLFELLKSQGMQMNQKVIFWSDGGDTVRDLQLYLNPQAEHLLDWFHITKRITVLSQYIQGLKHHVLDSATEIEDMLESIKWYLWHGNVFCALQKLEWLEWDVEALECDYPKLNKFAKAVSEFHGYIRNNAQFVPNYGEKWRYKETISSAFVESTVNQVISKRMEKKQQMRWTPKGAHLLLQVRTNVLNNDLKKTFHRWYPGLKRQSSQLAVAA